MSEFITAENLDLVIRKNREIKDEITAQAVKMQTNQVLMQAAPTPQLPLLILQRFGLIQLPVEDKFWSGAI